METKKQKTKILFDFYCFTWIWRTRREKKIEPTKSQHTTKQQNSEKKISHLFPPLKGLTRGTKKWREAERTRKWAWFIPLHFVCFFCFQAVKVFGCWVRRGHSDFFLCSRIRIFFFIKSCLSFVFFCSLSLSLYISLTGHISQYGPHYLWLHGMDIWMWLFDWLLSLQCKKIENSKKKINK